MSICFRHGNIKPCPVCQTIDNADEIIDRIEDEVDDVPAAGEEPIYREGWGRVQVPIPAGSTGEALQRSIDTMRGLSRAAGAAGVSAEEARAIFSRLYEDAEPEEVAPIASQLEAVLNALPKYQDKEGEEYDRRVRGNFGNKQSEGPTLSDRPKRKLRIKK